jgi:hypothetical protein
MIKLIFSIIIVTVAVLARFYREDVTKGFAPKEFLSNELNEELNRD